MSKWFHYGIMVFDYTWKIVLFPEKYGSYRILKTVATMNN